LQIAETQEKSTRRCETRRPTRSASLQRQARHFAKYFYLRRAALEQDSRASAERKHSYSLVVEQTHDIVTACRDANDSISYAVDLNHASNCSLHFIG
jgi:hypothetical protein